MNTFLKLSILELWILPWMNALDNVDYLCRWWIWSVTWTQTSLFWGRITWMSSRCRVTCLQWAPPATTLLFTPHYTTGSCHICVVTSCSGGEDMERTGVKGQASWKCLKWHAFTPPPLWQNYLVLLRITLFLKTTTLEFLFQIKRHMNFTHWCFDQLSWMQIYLCIFYFHATANSWSWP